MRSSLEQFERVSDYVSGKLTESQRSLFELEMSNDPFLQEQVDFQKDMVRVVERRALRSEIGAVAGSYATAGMSLMSKLLLGAGGAIMVGVVGYFFLVNPETEQKSKLAATSTKQSPAGQSTEVLSDSITNEDVIKFEPQSNPVSWNLFNRSTVHYMPPFYSVYASDMPSNLELLPGSEDNAGFVSVEEDSLMRELEGTSMVHGIVICDEKVGQSQDICFTILASIYKKYDQQALCSRISSDFFRFTCFRT